MEEYKPRYKEVAHLQYYDEVLKTFPEIKTDQELMRMFEKHSETKSVQLFCAYCDPSEPYKPITEYYYDVQPNKKTAENDVHVQPNKATEEEDSYLGNPIPEN